jgi:hypothetical protein
MLQRFSLVFAIFCSQVLACSSGSSGQAVGVDGGPPAPNAPAPARDRGGRCATKASACGVPAARVSSVCGEICGNPSLTDGELACLEGANCDALANGTTGCLAPPPTRPRPPNRQTEPEEDETPEEKPTPRPVTSCYDLGARCDAQKKCRYITCQCEGSLPIDVTGCPADTQRCRRTSDCTRFCGQKAVKKAARGECPIG